MPRYVIYARKSSDESDRQIKSIPDQIEQCREIAKRHRIPITEADEFRESKSAKVAGNRPIFNQLISLIGQGKVTGIICWHPDRLSRNGPEGGMLTGLLDQGSLKDLKFCTFNFENNTAGKMLLGIMFVMSKEYSDRLSDNIRRGVNSNLDQGKSVGSYKWGYVRNEEGFYEPHPVLFDYIKRAWSMRLEGKTNIEILKWLRLVGCERQSKKGNLFKMSLNRLTQIFNDPIYFGVLRQKEKEIDLREIYDFKAMITYEDWKKCQKAGRSAVQLQRRRSFYPFRDQLVTCACGQPCVPDKGKNYLYLYCSARKKCPLKQPRIRAKEIIDAGYEALMTHFNPTEEQQIALNVAYSAHVKRCITQSYEEVKEQRRQLTSAKNKAEDKLHSLVVASLGRALDPTERRVYEQEKGSCQQTIDGCNAEIARLEDASALKSFDYDEFSNFLKTAAVSWKLAHGEALHQMATFLFSNFTINGRKVQNLRFNRDIEVLFIPQFPNGGQAGKKFTPLGAAYIGLGGADFDASQTRMKNMTEKDMLRIAERQAAKISTEPSQERIVMELAAIAFAPKSVPVYHKESGTMVRAKVSPTDRMQALKTLGEHLGCFTKPESTMQQGSRLEYKEGMSADEARKSLLSYLRQQNRHK